MAIPTGSAATAVGSNNFTVSVTGCAVGDVWVAWGTAHGTENWQSPVAQSSIGSAIVTVYGAPLIGGTTVYYYACDVTGCESTERIVAIPQVTPIPTSTYGAAYRNLSQTRFSITSIPPLLMQGYTASGASATILWGIMMFFIMLGMWFRTRSVRLPLITGLLMAAFVANPSTGLYLGAPLLFQQIALAFMIACLAGILISFIRQ